MRVQVHKNGAVVTTVTQGTSDVCTVHVGFSIGMGNCGMEEKCHMAHVAEHMVAQLASSTYPDRHENRLMLNEQGVTCNAWTDDSRTVYHATGPAGGICMYLQMLMYTLTQRYVHAGTANELESVRQELSAAIPTNGRKTHCKIRELVYGEDPFLLENSIKYVESLQQDIGLATNSITDFINRYYLAESTNIIIATSARFADDVTYAAEALINTMKGKSEPALPAELEYCTPWKDLNSEQFIVHERSMDPQHGQARVTVLYEVQNMNRTMRYERLCMQLAEYALAGNMHSRLYKRLRIELGMVYFVSSHTSIQNKNAHTATLQVTTESKETNIAEVIAEIEKAVLTLRSKGLTCRELLYFRNTRKVLLQEAFADMSTGSAASRLTDEAAWHRKIMSLKQQTTELDGLRLEEVNTTVRNHLQERRFVVIGKA